MSKFAALTLLLTLASLPAAADEPAGWVLAVKGQWSIGTGSGPLVVGSPVPAGARLVDSNPRAGDHITVVAAQTGAVLASQRCASAADCVSPLLLAAPAQKPQGSAVAALLDRVLRKVAGEPDRYVVTLSRGFSPTGHAVLEWDGSGADLAPLFANQPAGDYEVRLEAPACTTGCAPTIVQLSWKRQGNARVAVPKAGAYEVSIERQVPTGNQWRNCRALLLPHGQFAAADSQFNAGRELVDSWGSKVDAATKQAFMNALLDSIAER